MSLGEKVREQREKKGMNQKQLAEVAQITQATISRIEKGKVTQLKSEALKRLAVALGVTVDYLVDKTNTITPNDVLQSDETAKHLFRGYEKLSSDGRKQLIDFVNFLASSRFWGSRRPGMAAHQRLIPSRRKSAKTEVSRPSRSSMMARR
ncbi:MAG TPA: helix-turn-helix transcriptional regulator [bacterium]|nr:helix-turn-helix transcriptional regulator [bacterium]